MAYLLEHRLGVQRLDTAAAGTVVDTPGEAADTAADTPAVEAAGTEAADTLAAGEVVDTPAAEAADTAAAGIAAGTRAAEGVAASTRAAAAGTLAAVAGAQAARSRLRRFARSWGKISGRRPSGFRNFYMMSFFHLPIQTLSHRAARALHGGAVNTDALP